MTALRLDHVTLMGRLALQIVRIGALGLLFRAAHRLLPPTVRLGSPAFVFCSAMFVAAAWLRHAVAGHEPTSLVLLATALAWAVLMLVSLARRTPEFALCLCISVSTDLLAAALSLAGIVDLSSDTVREVLLAWPLAAVFVALLQLRLARRRGPTMAAAWPTNRPSPTKD